MRELVYGGVHRIPVILILAVSLMVLEYLWSRYTARGVYDLKESAATLAIMVGQGLARGAMGIVVAPVYLFAYTNRLFTIPVDGVLGGLALFISVEFAYYWFHRLSHTSRWLWATHAVHHSSTHLNLSAAYRLGWTNALSGGWLAYVPLMFLGFHPVIVLAALTGNLLYQFFLHTQIVGTLGPLEYIFNTPAHHRVHHATNPECLDKNFGGVLIVFDRLFGTFAEAPRTAPLAFGLAGTPNSYNPLRIAFGEWIAMGRDVVRAPKDTLRLLFGRPGLYPEPKPAPPVVSVPDHV